MGGRKRGKISESLASLEGVAPGPVGPAVVDLGPRFGRHAGPNGQADDVSPAERAILDAAAALARPGDVLSISALANAMDLHRNGLAARVHRLRHRGLWPYVIAPPGHPRAASTVLRPPTGRPPDVGAADDLHQSDGHAPPPGPAPAPSQASGLDAELTAMARIVDALEGLDDAARRRVLAWLAARFGRG